jgi:hypothetical protein
MALTFTDVVDVTADVLALTCTLVFPAAIVAEVAPIVTSPELELASANVSPPCGAAAASVIVMINELPPFTDPGDTDTE